jgi:hypothetical protein
MPIVLVGDDKNPWQLYITICGISVFLVFITDAHIPEFLNGIKPESDCQVSMEVSYHDFNL